MASNIYDFSIPKINGKDASLSEYKGKVLLVVNVASECGLTPQYEALEKMYEKYKEQGFEVLGFPANEFGAQEPGTNEQIQEFCTSKFGIKFAMFQKIMVKGPGQHPLYNYLTNTKPDAIQIADSKFEADLADYGFKREVKKDILWNFEKFLINRQGQVVARFAPDMTPDDPVIKAAIEQELRSQELDSPARYLVVIDPYFWDQY